MPTARSFAAKLNRLFEEFPAPNGRRFSNTEVVETINAHGQDARLSPSYLSELLSGKKDNPSLWTVKALADFFGQPLDYFVEDREPAPRDGRLPAVVGAPTVATLGDRLQLVWALSRALGREPSLSGVVAAARASGVELSIAELEDAVQGRREALDADAVEAIARYFEVPTALLTDPAVADVMAAQIPATQLFSDQSVRRIAYRAHALSDSDRAIVSNLLDRLASESPGMSPDELSF